MIQVPKCICIKFPKTGKHEEGCPYVHDCFNHLDEAVRVGRAKYACAICGKDVSLAWYLYMMAVHELEE